MGKRPGLMVFPYSIFNRQEAHVIAIESVGLVKDHVDTCLGSKLPCLGGKIKWSEQVAFKRPNGNSMHCQVDAVESRDFAKFCSCSRSLPRLLGANVPSRVMSGSVRCRNTVLQYIPRYIGANSIEYPKWPHFTLHDILPDHPHRSPFPPM